MKYKHLFWAIILIAVGLLAILSNFGILHFSWLNFWRLWPLILIFWGISILPVKDTIRFTLLVAVILLTFLFFNRLPEHRPWLFRFHDFSDEFSDWGATDEGTTYNFKDQNLSVPYDSISKKGVLNLDAAAGVFTLRDTTNDFLDFSKTGYIGNYELTTNDANGKKYISLRLQDSKIRKTNKENNVKIKLNTRPLWDLDFNVGAAEIDLDLSSYKIDTADFEAGACSMTIKVGDKNPQSVFTFNAGASSITVKVPTTSGCQISSESFLVSREFEGFEKKGDRIYQTPGFDSSRNKVLITVKTAVSKIRVERY